MPSSVVYDANLGAFTLKQVRSCSYSGNPQCVHDYTSGGVAPAATYMVQATPQTQFSSGDLAGVIAGFTSNDNLFVQAGTIAIPWNLRANGGTFAAGSSHDKITATDGLFVAQSFSASQGDADGSSVSIQGYFHKTGGLTAPTGTTTSQSLSAAAYNATHQLGPGLVNGSAVSGITRVTVNTGISVEAELVDGGKYPVAHYITRRAPTIDVTGRYMTLMTALGPIFTTMTAAVFYFRKRADGGTLVADDQSEHLSFTFADGIVGCETVSGSGNSAGEVTLRLYGEALTISATAALEE